MLKEEDTISLTSFHFLHCRYDCTGRGVPCVYYRRHLMDLTSEWLYSLSPFSPTLELDFRLTAVGSHVCLSVTATRQTASEGFIFVVPCNLILG